MGAVTAHPLRTACRVFCSPLWALKKPIPGSRTGAQTKAVQDLALPYRHTRTQEAQQAFQDHCLPSSPRWRLRGKARQALTRATPIRCHLCALDHRQEASRLCGARPLAPRCVRVPSMMTDTTPAAQRVGGSQDRRPIQVGWTLANAVDSVRKILRRTWRFEQCSYDFKKGFRRGVSQFPGTRSCVL